VKARRRMTWNQTLKHMREQLRLNRPIAPPRGDREARMRTGLRRGLVARRT